MAVGSTLRFPAEVSVALGDAASVFEDWLQHTLQAAAVASELGPEMSARMDRFETGLTRASELRVEVAELRGQVTVLNSNVTAFREDIHALRTDMNHRFDAMGARFDSMQERIDRGTRWSVGVLALFGTMVTALLALETLVP